MKPTYEELLAVLDKLVTIADKCIPSDDLSNYELNEADNAISEAIILIHRAKEDAVTL